MCISKFSLIKTNTKLSLVFKFTDNIMKDLVSEVDILSRVEGDWTQPVITFLCTTYNQEDYIEQAIIGFLEQKTSFPYEILIHDDASTDGTKAIVESYRLRYPQIIRCIYQTENQYSQGISPLLTTGVECRGNYVALCEGDDYWINENKIENQFEVMMSDDAISMVVSPGKIERDGKILSSAHCYHGSEIRSFTAQEILSIDSQFAPTASYLLKRDYLIRSKDIFKKAPIGDLFAELYCAVNGKVVYYPEVGSVYRQAAKGSWTVRLAESNVEGRLKLASSLERTIENSRKVKGFEDLDWSVKLAATYYTIAGAYLKMREFNKFRRAIEKSYNYAHIAKRQKRLFDLRDCMFLLYAPSRPVLFFGRRLKRSLRRA